MTTSKYCKFCHVSMCGNAQTLCVATNPVCALLNLINTISADILHTCLLNVETIGKMYKLCAYIGTH